MEMLQSMVQEIFFDRVGQNLGVGYILDACGHLEDEHHALHLIDNYVITIPSTHFKRKKKL